MEHATVALESLTPIVARVLRIEDITSSEPSANYLVRYRGQLYGDSAQAYDQLAEALQSYEITPIFRNEAGRHAIFLIPSPAVARPSNPLVNLVLFVLTVISVLFTGISFASNEANTGSILQLFLHNLPIGIAYTVSLLSILVAHEFGHYLVGRYHAAPMTLPYFLPLPPPISPLGTLGAVILRKGPIKNKRILLDIGIAGPLAGFVVAIPVLLIGLSLSKIDVINLSPGQSLMLEGNSLIYLAAKYTVFGKLLPAPSSYGNTPVLLYWLKYFFTSQPLPVGGLDVMIHPVAWAGWAGLLVTAMNLIPVGQLDGGHAMHALFGERSRLLEPIVIGILVLMGFAWNGWWLWAFLVFLVSRLRDEPLDTITPLDGRRKFLAALALAIFILAFSPVPLVFFGNGL
jgi:membrane-associated protease RseP (regulator of RpoE activity)